VANGFNPSGMWTPNGRAFSQGVVAPQGHTIYVTGQVAWDSESNVVGLGDAEAQFDKCVENTSRVLQEVGGTLDDIVSLTIYFLHREDLPAIQRTRAKYFKVGTAPVSVLIQVPGLVIPELIVELVPVAVVPFERYREPGVL
jgi:enamine deaminase RidA (YjgF/YER057c/UK114 family)